MADLSTKHDPLHLRKEQPDYTENVSGKDNAAAETTGPVVGTDPHETSSTDVEKPVVHLDEEKVARAEREGKGFAS
ncbi:MAG: hypothetical protein ACK41D_09040 [Rubricoccaceae bacterium]